MLVERKIIKRNYVENMAGTEYHEGKFIAVGQWADGHMAYSRLDENDNVIEEDEGMFYQVKEDGHLLMVRC